MNDNRNEPKQLDSNLKCVASAECCINIQKDLDRPDKCLASLLEKDNNETEEHTEVSD